MVEYHEPVRLGRWQVQFGFANRCRIIETVSMTDSTDDTQDGSGLKGLGEILVTLPAVRAAKKANTLSRVHRRLLAPLDAVSNAEQQLAFQHTVFCQTSLPLESTSITKSFRVQPMRVLPSGRRIAVKGQ